MRGARFLLYGAVLMLSAAAPFLYVSQAVYAPKQEALLAAYQSRDRENEGEQEKLRTRARENERRTDEASRSSVMLQQESRKNTETLERNGARIERLQQRAEELEGAQARLTVLVQEAQAQAAQADSLVLAARQIDESLSADIAGLTEKQATLESQLRFASQEASRLEQDRLRWERRETYESTPRGALQGLVGSFEGSLCGGVDMNLWLARPWNQRLGARAHYLVEEDRGQELGFIGGSWQRLLSRRSYVDVWAGPHWIHRASGGSLSIDPALGFTLGLGVPKVHMGVGLTAMATPNDTLVGLTLGYSQIGEAIDVYRRRR